MHTAKEDNTLARYLRASSATNVWIGGNDLTTENTFEWSDDSGAFWSVADQTLIYSKWNVGEPNNVGNEDCAEMQITDVSHTWNDFRCTVGQERVCETHAGGTLSRVCEGQKTELSCPKSDQRLRIISAAYGRAADADVCPFSGSADVVTPDPDCWSTNAMAVVNARCEGQTTCTLDANDAIFGDPCQAEGSMNYLEVRFECVRKDLVVCQGEEQAILCPVGQTINVVAANYGRTHDSTCADDPNSDTNCVSAGTLDAVKDLCQGERACYLQAMDSVYGNSCDGVYKYLEVDYECVLPAAPAVTAPPTPAVTAAPSVPTVPTPAPTVVPGKTGSGTPTPSEIPRKLLLIDDSLTWRQARTRCLNEGGDLVSIKNNAESIAVSQYVMDTAGVVDVWIGGQSFQTAGTFVWSDGSGSLSDFKPAAPWESGQPDNFASEECVQMHASIDPSTAIPYWSNTDCTERKRAVCDIPTPGELRLFKTAMSWDDAQSTCELHGGNLASIHSARRHEEIANFIARNDPMRDIFTIWTGARHVGTAGALAWSDGTGVLYAGASLLYTNWDRGVPTGTDQCITLFLPSSRWRQATCTSTLPFVCEIPIQSNWMYESTVAEWWSAEAKCRDRGGHLVSIHGDTDDRAIVNMMRNSDPSIWLGLHNLNTNNALEWADNTGVAWMSTSPDDGTLLYTRWAADEPDNWDDSASSKVCAEMEIAGQSWSDKNCSDWSPYVCEMRSAPRKSIICEGQSLTLSCPRDTNVRIVSATYGRHAEAVVCPLSRAPVSTMDVDCPASDALFDLSNLCNGNTECTVEATSATWGDPCPGVTKYLEVQYECQESRFHLCDGESGAIVCPVGSTIQITEAVYGSEANSRHRCSTPSDVDCNQQASDTTFVANRCNGNRACFLNATTAVFGDVCTGSGKFLQVDYSCNYAPTPTMTRAPSPAPTLPQAGTPVATATPTAVPTPPPFATPEPGRGDIMYVYISDALNWHDARLRCLLEGGDLASVHTEGENRALAAFALGENPALPRVWIGGENYRSTGTFYWSDESGTIGNDQYGNWQTGQPDNVGQDHCIAMQLDSSQRGRWTNENCTTVTMTSVCEIPTPGEWEISTDPLPWEQARDACRAKGGDLVSPNSAREEARLVGQLKDGITKFWIGGNDIRQTNSFEWSDASGVFWFRNNGEDTSNLYSNWNGGEPNNFGVEDCVTQSVSGWSDERCGTPYPYVCELPIPGTWVYKSEAATWVNAEMNCRKDGGTLVSIHSDQEHDALVRFYSSIGTPNDVWIGGNDLGQPDNFHWSDASGRFWQRIGGDVLYSKWAAGQPDTTTGESCVESVRANNGSWNDAPCTSSFPYVCEKRSASRQVTICDDHASTLRCPQGFESLKIKSAKFGRDRDSPFCPLRAVSPISQSCGPVDVTQAVAERCDGQAECTWEGNPANFGPCDVNLHPYLQIEYDCLPNKKIVCQGESSPLICPVGTKIEIKFANYGRTLGTQVPSSCGAVPDTACTSGASLQIVRDLCDDERVCYLEATNAIYGETCLDGKYLEVDYVCVDLVQPVTRPPVPASPAPVGPPASVPAPTPLATGAGASVEPPSNPVPLIDILVPVAVLFLACGIGVCIAMFMRRRKRERERLQGQQDMLELGDVVLYDDFASFKRTNYDTSSPPNDAGQTNMGAPGELERTRTSATIMSPVEQTDERKETDLHARSGYDSAEESSEEETDESGSDETDTDESESGTDESGTEESGSEEETDESGSEESGSEESESEEETSDDEKTQDFTAPPAAPKDESEDSMTKVSDSGSESSSEVDKKEP